MIPPGCLVISFIFHFPIWIRYDLESSKRFGPVVQRMGMNFQEHSHAFATQQHRGFQPFLSTASSRAVGCVLEVELVNQLGGIRRTHILSFFHQDFSFKQTKRDVGVGVDGNPGPSPHICWLNYPCHLQVLTCFNDVFKGLVIPSYWTSSSVGSPIIYRVL